MRKIVLAGLCLMASNAFAQKSDALNWMAGTWMLKTNRGDMVEKWVSINDSTFQGKSMMVKAPGDSAIQETIELQRRSKAWFYVPTVQGQNNDRPVVFPVIFLGREEFIAHNPSHDFPQRIAYRKVKNQLFASIEGSRNGKHSKINFDFTQAGQ
jgi:Domain of unknown function (DUF6265)